MRRLLLGAVAAILSTAAQAQIIPNGSSFTLYYTNGPGGSSTDTTTVGSTDVPVNFGTMTMSVTTVPTGSTGEWLVVSLATDDGESIAGNQAGLWEIGMNFDTTVASNFNAVVDQFTAGGVGQPVMDIGSLCCESSNVPVFGGPGYANSGFTVLVPAGAYTSSEWFQIFISPYDFLSAAGPNPGAVSDFEFADHFGTFAPTIPEPSTWAMMLIGFAGLGFVGYRRTRRMTEAVRAGA